MRAENIVVESVSSKDVTTRFGAKKTYSFKGNGEWFSCGFKDPSVNRGDCLSFDFTPDTYGKQVDIKTIERGASGPVPGVPTPTAATSKSEPYSKYGVFPIPALDGQRTFIRQHAIEQATHMLVEAMGGKPFALSVSIVDDIISTARMFEAYTSGDADMAAAVAEVAATKHE